MLARELATLPLARNAYGQVSGGELRGHPVFVGTLFQPERDSHGADTCCAPLTSLLAGHV